MRGLSMGKDDPTLGAQATLPDAHAPAAEGGDEAPAHPSDVDHAHPGGELDAAAVAALQGLGNGPDAGSDLSPDHGLVGDDLVAAFHGIDVASNIDHAL